jgi:hypothetical protein
MADRYTKAEINNMLTYYYTSEQLIFLLSNKTNVVDFNMLEAVVENNKLNITNLGILTNDRYTKSEVDTFLNSKVTYDATYENHLLNITTNSNNISNLINQVADRYTKLEIDNKLSTTVNYSELIYQSNRVPYEVLNGSYTDIILDLGEGITQEAQTLTLTGQATFDMYYGLRNLTVGRSINISMYVEIQSGSNCIK